MTFLKESFAMLTILYEWKNSLTLFKKENIQLLLYSWYKLTKQLYQDLLYYFLLYFAFWAMSWAIRLLIGYVVWNAHPEIAELMSKINIVFIVFQYLVLLLARPTLEKKDSQYVLKKGLGYAIPIFITSVLYVLSIFLGTSLIITLFTFLVGHEVFLMWDFFKSVQFVSWIWISLFLLDSKGTFRDCFKAVWRGYKMVLFNLPISLLLVGFLIMLHRALSFIGADFASLVVQDLLYVAMYPAVIALITTLYIKRVHDQCNLYFGGNHA